MSRRERRLGIKYIHNEKERYVTFFKRRAGLFKCASNLSALTGARVAIVLETSIGKMHSFGTPSADPVVDDFLDGVPPMNPVTGSVTATRIARLQCEVAQLEDVYALEYKRTKLYIQRVKEIKVAYPGMTSNLVFSKEEDLSLEALNKLFNGLLLVHENIRHQLPTLHDGHELQVNGPSTTKDPLPLRGSSQDSPENTASSFEYSCSHFVPQDLALSIPVPSPQEHMLAPDFHYKLPQVFQSTPPSLEQQLDFVLPPIPNQVHEISPQLDLQLHTHACPHNIVEKSQNYTDVDSNIKHNLQDSTMLMNSNGNNIVTEDPFGYEHWAYALSDQPYYEEFLRVNDYLGCNGAGVGQLSMENGGYNVDAP
ncbi:hypothetical protein ZWY2020_002118 [Hordeum vulgare]|nr:hypothetical protein ZWY2020_002118 [Hordeum vulgare]